MRFLFTSDWQSDFENLDLCEKASQDIMAICQERHLQGFAVVGDLKRQYNPIDSRIVTFWMEFIRYSVRRLGLKVVLVLGNHDRVGMYSEAQNWLAIFRHAGADIVNDHAGVIGLGYGQLYCLPFSSSLEVTRRWSKELAADAAKKTWDSNVLLFHNDLRGTKYNVLQHESGAKLRAEDLHPECYDLCLGGHVHLRQRVAEGVYYIGNPFCSDWGEANQEKGYYIFISKPKVGEKHLEFVPSTIPGWYDPSWPRFPKDKKTWQGCRVRIHVPIEVGKDYGVVLDEARRKAEKQYEGATVYTVPEFQEEAAAKVAVKLSDPDKVKIESYVDETLTADLDQHRKAIIAYLAYKLGKVTHALGLRSGGGIKVLSAKGKNFLSFKSLEVDYSTPGLYLITGKNKDWMGRSNGSGKTNYQSPIPVAWFGMTFKGQKHDSWARNGAADEAFVEVVSKDSRNRLLKVVRGRRPGRLQLFVDKKDQSSGLQSTSKTGTQGLIERLLGFTWQTLANSIYIDQEQVNTFLGGTQAEQKRILERFQNLERFTKAQELVVKDLRMKDEEIDAAELEKNGAEAEHRGMKEAVVLKRKPIELQEAGKRLAIAQRALAEVSRKREEAKRKWKETRVLQSKELDKIRARIRNLIELRDRYTARTHVLKSRIESVEGVKGQQTCPTCFQPVNEQHLTEHVEIWTRKVKFLGERLETLRGKMQEVTREQNDLENRMLHLDHMQGSWSEQEDEAAHRKDLCLREYQIAKKYWAQEEEQRNKVLKNMKKCERRIQFWDNHLGTLAEEKAIFEYCLHALSRNGIPAFLNAQLCPALNAAAEHYSEVFTGKEIQVRFKVEDAEFVVRVLNAHGGATLQDQSAGEKKMAGIIASFALREVAPKCNVLILDEPGDGLDAVNAKAFAVGLKKIRNQLGTIFLTSHNPVIVGELSGESCITVAKKGGISQVEY